MKINFKNGIVTDKTIKGVPVEVNIIQRVTGRCRPGIKMNPKFSVYHETGNTNRGADARMHRNYIQNLERDPKGRQVSYHFAVDDKRIVQCLPINEVAWCQGDGNGPGNMQGISVEQCVNSDGDRNKSIDNACRLHGALIESLGLSLRKHQDFNGKKCPYYILSAGRWSEIRAKVQAYVGWQAKVINDKKPQAPNVENTGKIPERKASAPKENLISDYVVFYDNPADLPAALAFQTLADKRCLLTPTLRPKSSAYKIVQIGGGDFDVDIKLAGKNRKETLRKVVEYFN